MTKGAVTVRRFLCGLHYSVSLHPNRDQCQVANYVSIGLGLLISPARHVRRGSNRRELRR